MVPDSSIYVYSFAGFIYGSSVAELTEELPSKLTSTNSAGMSGKRIGENFQDIKRLIVQGNLNENSEENEGLLNPLPLRAIVQRFRFAHRSEIGKARLVLNSAADGRPAEFVFAAVENVTGLKWEQPINQTDFEISFLAEPEVWYDDLQTVDIKVSGATVGDNVTYTKVVNYVGPDDDFFADAEALPLLTLVVSSIVTDQLGTADPPYVEIKNDKDDQTFRLYPDGNGTFIIDAYEEGIRKGSTWDAGTIYEAADYDQFIYLTGAANSAGVDNTITTKCRFCDLTSGSLAYYPRHW
jgi:hypothetical protein